MEPPELLTAILQVYPVPEPPAAVKAWLSRGIRFALVGEIVTGPDTVTVASAKPPTLSVTRTVSVTNPIGPAR